jgi:hypothetical protein
LSHQSSPSISFNLSFLTYHKSVIARSIKYSQNGFLKEERNIKSNFTCFNLASIFFQMCLWPHFLAWTLTSSKFKVSLHANSSTKHWYFQIPKPLSL